VKRVPRERRQTDTWWRCCRRAEHVTAVYQHADGELPADQASGPLLSHGRIMRMAFTQSAGMQCCLVGDGDREPRRIFRTPALALGDLGSLATVCTRDRMVAGAIMLFGDLSPCGRNNETAFGS
jgi:hypothetical protein